jgi:ParB-like chromosome segregation protein Spo0J
VTSSIGQIELNGELIRIPLNELVEDVAVDLSHVRELAQSIKDNGQLVPIVVWEEEGRIIDGFHRLSALRQAGSDKALCISYSCDEEAFWNLRILSDSTHRSVSFARVVEWVELAFSKTPWRDKVRAEEAFTRGRRGATPRGGLTIEERKELGQWVGEKSRLWNIPVMRIREMLKIANIAGPTLTRQVRDEQKPGALTQSILRAVVTQLPRQDLREAVVQKVRDEKLTLRDTEGLVEQVSEASTEQRREELVQLTYQRPRPGRSPESVARSLHELRTRYVTEALGQLNTILPELAGPQSFDNQMKHAYTVIALYLGGEDVTALEILQRENQAEKEEIQRLTTEVRSQKNIIEAQQGTITSQQHQIENLLRERTSR